MAGGPEGESYRFSLFMYLKLNYFLMYFTFLFF